MSTLIQRSFAGGELAPALYARVDSLKYTTGARTMRNLLVMRHGGATNRPGTGFVCEVKDSTNAVRFIKFAFNDFQTYLIEVGNLYMRFVKSGAQVLEAAKTITGVTQANPAVVTTSIPHGYSTGDEVAVTGVSGMSQVNGRNFKVVSLTSTTFQLGQMSGTQLDSTGYGAYTSGGNVARVYTLITPYASADISTLNFVESADVITLTHPNYAPMELARVSDTSWTLSTITFSPSMTRPSGVSVAAGAAGTASIRYTQTAISRTTGEESLPSLKGSAFNITAVTNAGPPVVTTSGAHGFSNGDHVYISGISGMTEINGRGFIIAGITGTTFQLVGEDATSYGVYTSGGTVQLTSTLATSVVDPPTAAAPNVLTWTATTGASEYNIYKERNGVFGLIGIAQGTTFNDVGTSPDTTISPPEAFNPFNGSGNYPSAVAYIQQRLAFANTNNSPEQIRLSRTGRFKNFTTSTPIHSDDAATFKLVGRQVNQVRHMVDLGKLLVFTSGVEWAVNGDISGTITPTDINARPYTYNGCSTVAPLVIGSDVLYIQARGSIVRDLAYEYAIQGYRGNDLTIFSAHLFDGFTLVDWTYQQIPHSVVWAVRSDGTLLGLTYVKEHELVAWHRHDTLGIIENVCAVPEGAEDAVYLCVKRTINGRAARYIERMKQRRVSSIVDCVFSDASLTYDGRNTGSTTMTLSGGTAWTNAETLTLTSSTSQFSASDVGNQIFLDVLDVNGNRTDRVKFLINAFTSGTVVTGTPHKTVPASLRATATTHWAKAVATVTGAWHLEGQNISALGDGFVIANPNNAAYVVRTVSSGSVTFDKPYSVIQLGLPYFADIETLDIDSVNSETMVNKKRTVQSVTMEVESSRGLWVGARPPTDDTINPLEGLYEPKLRNTEKNDQPINLKTGPIDIEIRAEWNSNGRVFVRQTDPLPVSILAIAPSGMFPQRVGA